MPPQRVSDQMIVHFYRAELARSDNWRNRLDNTTNWALTTAAAVITFTFASPESSHTILVVGGFLVWMFLLVEARRYRYYDLWIRRVRLLEDGVIAPVLRNEPPDPDALRELADLVTSPRLLVSSWDAIGLRLRRAYAPIFLVLVLAWLAKIFSHPEPAHSPREAIAHAHIGPLPGPVITAMALVAVLATSAVYFRSLMRPIPRGELATRRRPRRPLVAIFRRAQPAS